MAATICIKHNFIAETGTQCPDCHAERMEEHRTIPQTIVVELSLTDNVNSRRKIQTIVVIPPDTWKRSRDDGEMMAVATHQALQALLPTFLNLFHTKDFNPEKILKNL